MLLKIVSVEWRFCSGISRQGLAVAGEMNLEEKYRGGGGSRLLFLGHDQYLNPIPRLR